MECCVYEKFQYVGKLEYSLNIRINTHRHDKSCSPCEKHFQVPGHNFNAYTKFIIIEEVYNKSL